MFKAFRHHVVRILIYNIETRKSIASQQNSSEWKSVIGLEVHAQISTKSKLFSSGSSTYGLPTNTCVNLFDAAIPGTLPVLNKKAVELAVLTSLALKCTINPVSCFDRKHYFYSDLPNGYQITQQRLPIAKNGHISYAVFNSAKHKQPYYRSSKIKQVQLEQDSGKSFHEPKTKQTYIDLNRAGIALMEIVFEPDLDDAEEAAALIKELCSILQRLGSCSCKMEEGALRVDANISVHKKGTELGVRTEVKNIGSVRGVANAINYEITRQVNLLKNGGSVTNQTLAWSAEEKRTIALRDKEGEHDYRYMPEPNLPPLRVLVDEDSKKFHSNVKYGDSILDLRHLKDKVPWLPCDERNFLLETYKTSDLIAVNIVNDPILYKYFTDILSEDSSRAVTAVYNVLTVTLLTSLNKVNMKLDNCTVPSKYLGELVDMKDHITSDVSQAVLMEILNGNQSSPKEIVKEKKLGILSEEELQMICKNVIENNAVAVKDYLKGKEKVMKFFVRKVLEASELRAKIEEVKRILVKILQTKKSDK